MGFNLNKAKAAKEEILNSFTPVELNDGNVQSLFNSCLSNQNTNEFTYAVLFPSTHGYKPLDEIPIQFDAVKLLKNKQTIEYLFGQLQEVHNTHKKRRINIDDYNTTYHGTHWTSDKETLLKFLYLGVSPKTVCITPFRAESSTSIISPQVKPTLSPKDPSFPAWWEQHRAEWEQ